MMKFQIIRLVSIYLIIVIVVTGCTPILRQIDGLLELAGLNKSDGSDERTNDKVDSPPKPISEDKAVGSTWFGMGSNTHMRSNQIDSDYAEMARLGVKMVREDIPWQEVQTGVNSYNLDYRGGILQQAVASAERYGLNIVALLAYSPPEHLSYSTEAEFIEYWKGYVRSVVDRYGDQIDHWEVGNEVNTWWHKVRGKTEFEPGVYMKMLYEAWEVIKKADPSDTVILSSLVNIDSAAAGLDPFETLRRLADLNVQRYCDALALHVYWPNMDPDQVKTNIIFGEEQASNMVDYVKTFIEQSERYLGKRLPIWITETGYDFDWLENFRSDYHLELGQLQAVMLLKTYVSLLSIPEVQSVFWYSWLNDETDQNFAISASAKETFQTMTSAIGQGRSVGRFDAFSAQGELLEPIMDYRFERGDGKIISYSWSRVPGTDNEWARLEPVEPGLVLRYNPDKNFTDQPGAIGPEDPFLVGLIPAMLIGEISPSAHIVIGDVSAAVTPPLVYTKDGNIWAYYLDEDRKIQVTQDGAPFGASGESYSDPRVSPNGRYVAFVHGGFEFVLYNLENHSQSSIPMASSADILGDTLLGWSENNELYYTRMVGGCSFDPLKGPEAIQVYLYNPETDQSEYQFDLPKVNPASHAYSIGIRISPNGRKVLAYNAACSVGLGSTFIFDSETGSYSPPDDIMQDFSVDGLYTAVSEYQPQLTQQVTYWINIFDSNGEEINVVHMGDAAGELAIDPHFSSTGKYLAFIEAVSLESGWTQLDTMTRLAVTRPDQLYLYVLDDLYPGFSDDLPYLFTPVGSHDSQWFRFGAFSPDDKHLAFFEGQPGNWNDPVSLTVVDIGSQTLIAVDQVMRNDAVDW